MATIPLHSPTKMSESLFMAIQLIGEPKLY